MKLSKEASKLFHEYECAQRDGTIPQYLNPDKLNNTFGTVRRISSELDNIFNQVVYKIIEPHVLLNSRQLPIKGVDLLKCFLMCLSMASEPY